MKVFDRYTGAEAVLPAVVEPGRYRLSQAAVLNDGIALQAGEVLWSDGSSHCMLRPQGLPCESQRSFALPPLDKQRLAREQLVNEAVRDVVLQLQASDDAELPSPVMPAQLGDMAQVHRVEQLLRATVDAGHLHAIAKRPRMDMRYDAEVLPLSRARRLAADALTRLAAHSEDWHRRDLTGVLPARLKAEVSEDELVIYENVVYVRLLERLQQRLEARIGKLKELLATHDEADQLMHAQQLHRRLLEALCSLWGQSFEESQAAAQLLQQTLDELQALLGQIRQLQRSALVQAIPVARRIPVSLRNTNVLQHDPHYQHLRPLWIQVHEGQREQALPPQDRYDQARAQGQRYADYVGLLIRHAVAASKLLQQDLAGNRWRFGPWALHLEPLAGDWQLRLYIQGQDTPATLTVVPAERGGKDWQLQLPGRLVLYCHPDEAAVSLNRSGGASVLNPLEFYAVERVRAGIETWLLRHVLDRYPFAVKTVPTELGKALVQAAPLKLQHHGKGLQVVAPPSSKESAALEALIHGDRSANETTRHALAQALSLADLLATCRVCGEPIRDKAFKSSAQGFKARCVACEHDWLLQHRNDGSAQARYWLGSEQKPFADTGSLELTLAWRPKTQPAR